MKKLIFALISLSATASFADQYVNGYYRSNGTYVQPYHRTEPDSTKLNNYSTVGNTNPYTGKAGTVNPYGSTGNTLNNTSWTNSNSGYGSQKSYGE